MDSDSRYALSVLATTRGTEVARLLFLHVRLSLAEMVNHLDWPFVVVSTTVDTLVEADVVRPTDRTTTAYCLTNPRAVAAIFDAASDLSRPNVKVAPASRTAPTA